MKTFESLCRFFSLKLVVIAMISVAVNLQAFSQQIPVAGIEHAPESVLLAPLTPDQPATFSMNPAISGNNFQNPGNTGTSIHSFSSAMPPPNDECIDVVPITLVSGVAQNFQGTTVGATPDTAFNNEIPVVWESFQLTDYCNTLEIEFCGSPNAFPAVYTLLRVSCPSEQFEGQFASDDFEWDSCADENPTIRFSFLPPGTYYYPVVGEVLESNVLAGDYSIFVTTESCTPPENNNCEAVLPTQLVDGVPQAIMGNTIGATSDTAQFAHPVVWEAFELEGNCNSLKIEYCGNDPGYSSVYTSLFLDCPDTAGNFLLLDSLAWNLCPDGITNPILWYYNLPPGTYYHPVMGYNQGLVTPGEYEIYATPFENCFIDCNGDLDGTAYIDDCSDCVGGNTGVEPCVYNCIDELGQGVVEVPSLPYYSQDRTTCGAGDDLNSVNTISCENVDGEEEVFVFTPTVSDNYHIEVNGSTHSGRISLFTGCPLLGQGGECVGSATTSGLSPDMLLSANLEAGQTYYLVISRSNCFTYDISIDIPATCPDGLGNGVVNITSLPFYSEDRTTCGAGDDLNSANTISCGNVDGEEEVFVFTPTVSDNYHIEVNGSTHSGRISLFTGCPLLGQGGECVGSATTSGLSPDMLLSANLEAGQTYYLVISRSNCFTYDISIDVPDTCPDGLGNGVVNIASLPFYSEDRTTCGAGDDLNSANTISCGNVDGEEEVFVFTPTVSDNYHIEVNGSTHSGRISLFSGCPLLEQGGVCVGSTTTSGLSPDMLLSANLEAGQTYYLIISRSNCFTYDISIDVPLTCPDGLGNGVVNVPSLPYNSENRTTCGAGNDLNTSNTESCGAVNQEEEVFIITPDQTDSLYIEINSSTQWSAMSLYAGCPLLGQGGVCLGTETTGTHMVMSAYVEVGQTYYLIVTRSSGSGCVEYDIDIEYGSRPLLTFLTDENYNGENGVYPLSGDPNSLDPNAVFEYRVSYSHPGGLPPMAGYPVVGIDMTGNNELDEVVSLMEVDVNDQNYTDGKEYFFVRGFEINGLLQYAFMAYDSTGKAAQGVPVQIKEGPLVFADSLDLFLYANDILFEPMNPDVGEPVTITARIHNQHYFTANDVPVHFYSDDIIIDSTVVSSIAPNGYIDVTITTTFEEVGYFPIKVVIDKDNTISEGNKLNNFAIRPVVSGDFVMSGHIIIELDDSTTTACEGSGFLYKGTATYSEEFGDNIKAAGAEIFVTNQQTGIVYKGYTNSAGRFAVTIAAPSTPGTYTFGAQITDFVVQGVAPPFHLHVVECPVSTHSGGGGTSSGWDFDFTFGPGGCGCSSPDYEPDLAVYSHFISPTSINPEIDENIQIITSLENSGQLPANNFWVQFRIDGEPFGEQIFVPQLYHGFSTSVMATDSFASDVQGFHTIEVELDPLNEIEEETIENNIATRGIVVGDIFDLSFLFGNGLLLSESNLTVGQEIVIDAAIQNLGPISATATVNFYTVFGADTTLFDSIPFGINAMDTVNLSANWTATQVPGKIYAKITNVDPATEASTENNIAVAEFFDFECIENFDPCDGLTEIDYNGDTYALVAIDGKCWFADNLRTSQYRNGDLIPHLANDLDWQSAGEAESAAWAHYANDSANEEPYGKLYNSFVVDDPRGICPDGWHIPSDEDWYSLRDYLDPNANGNMNEAGGLMKVEGTDYWLNPNTGATNESGFTAYPGGMRNLTGAYIFLGSWGVWVSSTFSQVTTPNGIELETKSFMLQHINESIQQVASHRGSGHSLRCVLEPVGVPCDTDCNGDLGGDAFVDECGTCVEGNTGETACVADCNGDFGGSAFLDDCGICVGGNTGEEACIECELELLGSATPATSGSANGTASVAVSGGTEPYEYAWNDPLFQNTATATGLFAGTYVVTVTDANACEAQLSVEVPVESSVPNTKVSNMFCNTGGYYLSDFISADGISGANAYRWEFTDSQNNTLPEFTRYDGNKWIRLEWISDIETDETYNVRVKARISGTWGEYATVCSIQVSPIIPTTEIRPNYTPTNAQGNDYGSCDFAIAYNISNSQNFRWRFDGNGTFGDAEDIVYTRGTNNPSVRLSWINGLTPGLTYNVGVEVQVDGIWSGYGTVLPLSLALPPNDVEIRSQFCGGTYAPNGYILSESVCEADLYQFRFTPTGGGSPSFRNSGNYACFMSAANPALVPGDYDVQVKITQNGVPGDWGPVCNITISGPQGQEIETPVLRELEQTGSAVLFPNPNTGSEVRIQLKGLSDGNHDVNIGVYDIYGKLIATEGFGHEGSSLNRLLRFSNVLSTGMYMVHISVDGKRFSVEKLIVD